MKQFNSVLWLTIVVLVLSNSKVKCQSFSWAASFPNSGIGSFFCDSNNNIISVGGFTAPVDVDPSANTYMLTPVGNYDWFVTKVSSSGNLIWAKHFDGTTNPAGLVLGMSFTKDSSDNIYAVGYLKDSFDFDPGLGTYYLTATSSNYHSSFILKLNANGDFVWAKEIEANVFNSNVNLLDIKVIGSNVYIVGSFLGTVDVNPGIAVNNLTAGSMGSGLIEKLDTAGNFQWAKQINGAGIQFLQLDFLSNLYCASTYTGTVDFDPGQGNFTMTTGSSTGYALFFEKIDSAGNFQWAKQIGTGVNNEYIQGVNIDRLSNLYVTGYFNNTLDFDPGPAIHNLSASSSSACFLLKLTSNGNYSWANTFGAVNGRSVTTDSLCNVYTTGEYSGGDLDPGPGVYNLTPQGSKDVFVQKLDSSGNFIWAESFGTTDWDIPGHVCLDYSNNIIITGSMGMNTGGSGDFDPGLGIFSMGGTNAGFLEKLCITPPTINITVLNDTICVGDTAYLSVDAIQGATYVWGKDGNPIANSNHDSLKVTQSGSYTVGIYGVGCPYGSDTIHITVLPVVSPSIIIYCPSIHVPIGQQVTVNANVWATGGYPYTIDWYNHGVLFATTSTNTATYTKQAGKDSITAIITVNNPCNLPVTSNLAVVDGITDISTQNQFVVYPNPANNTLYIQSQQSGYILLSDITGRVMLQSTISNPQSTIDINWLKEGIYIYRFESNDKRTSQGKMVIVR